ncbi:MAG: VTT domain-containing protein, partial [Chloroflexota bacterium]
GIVVVIVLMAAWIPLSQIEYNPESWRAWIEGLGPFAPLAFFLLNVIQIVVAPIPGYPVQVMGGILFGFIPGSIYTVGGMVAGGTLAAWLGRRLGRPWLEKRVGTETLDDWGSMARIDSFWTWWIILLIPFGDIPYFFAGLSKIRLSMFALAILTSRGPFTVLIVLLGDRIVDFPITWIALTMAVTVLIVIIGFSQSERIEKWGRTYITRWANDDKGSEP